MSQILDIDVLKEIPGYKAILKSVVKIQIQLLIEQLADHTGEESIILTASVNDGTLSQLGSDTGKQFLTGRDEIKSQFLGHCLKSHHKKKTQESQAPPYQRSHPTHPGPRTAVQPQTHPPPNKRPKLYPVSVTRTKPKPNMPPDSGGDSSDTSTSMPFQSQPRSSTPIVRKKSLATHDISIPDNTNVKLEGNDNTDNVSFDTNASLVPNTSAYDPNTSVFSPTKLPSSVHTSHTQASTDDEPSQTMQTDILADALGSSTIKIEPVTESELDLEITGVDMGDSDKMATAGWGAGAMDQSGAEGDNQGGEQSEYNDNADLNAQDSTVKKQLQKSGHKSRTNIGSAIQKTTTVAKSDINSHSVDTDSDNDDVLSVESSDTDSMYKEIDEDIVEIHVPYEKNTKNKACGVRSIAEINENVLQSGTTPFKQSISQINNTRVAGDLSSADIDNELPVLFENVAGDISSAAFDNEVPVLFENVAGETVSIGEDVDDVSMADSTGEVVSGASMIRKLDVHARIHSVALDEDSLQQKCTTSDNSCSPRVSPRTTVMEHMRKSLVSAESTPKKRSRPTSTDESTPSKRSKQDSSIIDSPSTSDWKEQATCKVCAKKLRNKWDLFEHAGTHMTDKRFLCYKCNDRFSVRLSFTKHFKECSPKSAEVEHCCYKCKARFDRPSRFYEHFTDCIGEFGTDISAGENINALNPDKAKVNTDVMPKEPLTHEQEIERSDKILFKCEKCNKKFRFRVQKNFHLRKCTGKLDSVSQKIKYRNTNRKTKSPVEDRTCSCCNKVWGKPSTMKYHMQRHKLKYVSLPSTEGVASNSVCKECGKCFSCASNLQIHMLFKHKQAKVEPHTTGKVASKVVNKIKNKKGTLCTMHNMKTPVAERTCSCCNKIWNRPYQMRKHMATKRSTKRLSKLQFAPETETNGKGSIQNLKCSVCKKVFANAAILRKHSIIHTHSISKTPAANRTCSCCNKIWPHPYRMRKHMATQQSIALSPKHQTASKANAKSPDPNTKCMDCGKNCSNSWNLRRHSALHCHEMSVGKALIKGSVKPATKVLASKIVKKSSIKGSKKTPVNERTCSCCNKVWAKPCLMKYHMQSHAPLSKVHISEPIQTHPVGNFACKRCGKVFHGEDKLRRHSASSCTVQTKIATKNIKNVGCIRKSRESRIHPCPVCGKLFTSKCSVPRHLEVHKRLNHYRCMVCSAILPSVDQWESHITEHKVQETSVLMDNDAGNKETSETIIKQELIEDSLYIDVAGDNVATCTSIEEGQMYLVEGHAVFDTDVSQLMESEDNTDIDSEAHVSGLAEHEFTDQQIKQEIETESNGDGVSESQIQDQIDEVHGNIYNNFGYQPTV